jgi:Ca2+-binding EF-hand superfamily protein
MTASKLTPEQIEEFKQAFKMLDANGDGMISHNVTLLKYRN